MSEAKRTRLARFARNFRLAATAPDVGAIECMLATVLALIAGTDPASEPDGALTQAAVPDQELPLWEAVNFGLKNQFDMRRLQMVPRLLRGKGRLVSRGDAEELHADITALADSVSARGLVAPAAILREAALAIQNALPGLPEERPDDDPEEEDPEDQLDEWLEQRKGSEPDEGP